MFYVVFMCFDLLYVCALMINSIDQRSVLKLLLVSLISGRFRTILCGLNKEDYAFHVICKLLVQVTSSYVFERLNVLSLDLKLWKVCLTLEFLLEPGTSF